MKVSVGYKILAVVSAAIGAYGLHFVWALAGVDGATTLLLRELPVAVAGMISAIVFWRGTGAPIGILAWLIAIASGIEWVGPAKSFGLSAEAIAGIPLSILLWYQRARSADGKNT